MAEEKPKGRKYKAVTLHTFNVQWGTLPDGSKHPVFQDMPTNRWIIEEPPVWPPELGNPPGDMISYLATAFEPMDMALGGYLFQVLRAEPAIRDKVALRLCDEMLRINLADAILQTCKEPDIDRKEPCASKKIMANLLERGGLVDGFIDAILSNQPLDYQTRLATGINIIKGLAQLLLTQRAVRERSLMEYHLFAVTKGIAGENGADKLMGETIRVALVIPDDLIEVVPPAPTPEVAALNDELQQAIEAKKAAEEAQGLPVTPPPEVTSDADQVP